jgi:predicted neuraminidase
MADSQDLPDCNPVLFIDPRGKLWLFWIAVQNNQWGGSLLKYKTAQKYSKPGSPQWDWQDVIHCRPQRLEEMFLAQVAEVQPQIQPLLDADPKFKKEVEDAKISAKDKLAQRLGWMTRLHPIMLSPNRIMLGLYSDVFNGSLAAFTNDWGKTWEFSEPILGLGNIQPSFIVKKDGTINAYMRDNGLPNRIRTSESNDGGIKWSPVQSSTIPNPGSSLECIPLKSGAWLLVCNDTKDGRHQLTAYLSEDEGETWKCNRSIEKHEKNKASASYPSVMQDKRGLIHCTYSFTQEGTKGSTIKHATFNEQWIKTTN